MEIQQQRQCPECGKHTDGTIVNESNTNLKRFECEPCEEEWYEDIKYCIPETISVS